MSKQNLAVIFGGQSSEHEISCMSASNIIQCIDAQRYNIILVGITKEGHWVEAADLNAVQDGSWRQSKTSIVLSPDATRKGLYRMSEDEKVQFVHLDVIFPVLHGLYGEDGTVQGLFKLAGIPFVGCGLFASAAGMDKLYTKIIVDTLGIRQAKYVPVYKEELPKMDEVVARVESALEYPVFVKPSRAGSSKGVNKAANREQLKNALIEAADNDRKILVEETIIGREVECAVLGNLDVKASGVGEILSADEFYDFDAKYYNAESKTVVDPELPNGATERVREAAVKIFNAVDGYGLSRVDFFVKADGTVVFNEINTLPGFTAISMYPMLWEARGVNKKQLIDDLINHAFKRYER